jgi:Nucleotidyltransferase domain
MDIAPLVKAIVDRIKRIDGVSAVVLGGSRARGTHTPTSDVDLSIYYHPDSPLDVNALDQVATEFDDSHRAGLVTPLGGWGPWINGGGWLTIESQPVDFLYRDLKKVGLIIDACLGGEVEVAYQPGHPHGFVSSIYFAEVALCQPLWEANRHISALKSQTHPFPSALRNALIKKFAWEIEFSLRIARKSVARADVAYAAGCCFRCVSCILLVVFALNEQYWLNEKGAVALANTFPILPPRFKSRIEEVFASLAADGHSIAKAIAVLETLSRDMDLLVAGV